MRVMRALTLLALVGALAGCGTVGGWFGFGDTKPRKQARELAPFTPSQELTRAWEINVGPGKPYVFMPAGNGQALYAAGREGRVARIDLTSGREVWRVDLGKPLSSGVAAGSGLVVVATPKGEVIALAEGDGKVLWSAALGGEILGSPSVGDGFVLARALDGKVTQLDARDGKKKWSAGRSQPSLMLRGQSDILLAGKVAFVGYPGGKLQALSLANGDSLWEASVAQPRGATEIERMADVTGAISVEDGLVCAAAYQGRLACFDAASGNPIWARDFSSLTGAVQDDKSLYAVDDKDNIQAFERMRGSGLWKQAALENRRLTSVLPMGKYLAVADGQGYIHILDSATGMFVARASTDGGAITGRLLALNDGLVAQTENGGVFAFKLRAAGPR